MAGIHRRRLTKRRVGGFSGELVFVNCPFDRAHEEVFDAIVFALFYCGRQPVTAASREDNSEPWLDYIVRQLQSCFGSVHDITPVLGAKGECRYNMAFELGVAFGADRRGDALIFVENRRAVTDGFSDLGGVELREYAGDKGANIARQLTQWLIKQKTTKAAERRAPAKVEAAYKKFRAKFRAFCEAKGWKRGDNLSYKVALIGEWVASANRGGRPAVAPKRPSRHAVFHVRG